MHSFGAAEYGMENSETKAKFFLAASSQDYLPNMDEWKTAVRCGTVQILIMLDISCREYKTNEYVWQQANILAGCQELLLANAKRHNSSWFAHVCRHDTTRSSGW